MCSNTFSYPVVLHLYSQEDAMKITSTLNPGILYPAKLSFKIDEAIKVFHDKQKLRQYMTTKPPLQKILQGILHARK
jgi:hypothetical protein